MENKTIILNDLLDLFKKRQFLKVDKYFTTEEYQQFLIDNVGEILPYLFEEMINELTATEDFVICTSWITFFVDHVSPKEMLIFLLEQFEKKFSVYLLVHLKNVLLKMPTKRGSSFEWALSTLTTHIYSLALPNDYNFEGDERKLLDLDPEVKNITNILPFYVDFLHSFVIEVSMVPSNKNYKTQVYSERIEQQREILSQFILNIIGHPIAFLDLHHKSTDSKSTARVIAEDLLNFLSQLEGNTMRLYRYTDNIKLPFDKINIQELNFETILSKLPKNDESALLSTATLAYLLLAEETTVLVNSVFSPQFLLTEHLKYLIVLLIHPEYVIMHKGLLLGEALLCRLSDCTLSNYVFDMPEIILYSCSLFRIMIYCQNQEFRQIALKSFKLFVDKFLGEGQARLLSTLLQVLKHSGAQSLIIQLFKNKMHKELSGGASNVYKGKTLQTFINLAAILPNSAECDLLQSGDAILATLNFLRYLFKVDSKSINKTGVWKTLPNVKKMFLEPLRVGLELSKAHYKLEMQNNTEHSSIDSAVSVSGIDLPPLSQNQKKDVYNSALTSFDVIESVLSRVEEIVAL